MKNPSCAIIISAALRFDASLKIVLSSRECIQWQACPVAERQIAASGTDANKQFRFLRI